MPPSLALHLPGEVNGEHGWRMDMQADHPRSLVRISMRDLPEKEEAGVADEDIHVKTPPGDIPKQNPGRGRKREIHAGGDHVDAKVLREFLPDVGEGLVIDIDQVKRIAAVGEDRSTERP